MNSAISSSSKSAERQQDRQPGAEPESFALAGGQHESEVLEKGRLAGSRITEEDQPIVLLEQLQHRHRRAQPLPQAHQLVRARRPARHAELAP
jgi:hypothetical protein